YLSPRIRQRYGVDEFSQFHGAETIARSFGFTREQLDAYALQSHLRAAKATADSALEAEILPLPARLADGSEGAPHRVDEGVRADASAQALAGLKTLRDGGVITAGNASQICDGAAAVLVANEQGLRALGAEPLARIHHMSVLGGDPVVMLLAPLEATRRALRRSGLALRDIELYEVNEAFASVPLAWARELDADPTRLNVHGGAIALGHPLGASGARLMSTLVHALHRRGARYGLQTMCEGGGMANVTIVERL
ncbi:MAG: acetyl-CoA C-acyltransferase, partial [Betaproteobacteria bacterium]|nr:acetyl-CoA C-acyltransferase [Betaproteobacteria bacterium]